MALRGLFFSRFIGIIFHGEVDQSLFILRRPKLDLGSSPNETVNKPSIQKPPSLSTADDSLRISSLRISLPCLFASLPPLNLCSATHPSSVVMPPTSEKLFISLAAVVAVFPVLYLSPTLRDRLAAQTIHWAPRWERNITYFVSPAQRAAESVEPPAKRAVGALERAVPMEKGARALHGRIEREVERWWGNKSWK